MNTATRAKKLRRGSTDAERRLWREVRNRRLGGHKFRRQQPLRQYIVDFVCFERKLIVELDGGQHNDRIAYDYDSERTAWLESQGFRVLRLWNNQVMREIEEVNATIANALDHQVPSPSDGRGLG